VTRDLPICVDRLNAHRLRTNFPGYPDYGLGIDRLLGEARHAPSMRAAFNL